MPNTYRSARLRPTVGLLLDALYNEYASMVVAAVQEDDIALLVARHRKPACVG